MKDVLVSSLIWFLLCAYLIVAATTLLEVELRPVRGARLPSAALCVVALCFAATWPVRGARSAWRRFVRR